MNSTTITSSPIKFYNVKLDITLEFAGNTHYESILHALSLHDTYALHLASLGHCLNGNRRSVGNWKIQGVTYVGAKKYNKTERKQGSEWGAFTTESLDERYTKLAQAIKVLKAQGKRTDYLEEQLLQYKTASRPGRKGDDLNTHLNPTVRLVDSGLRKMAVKSGTEKYDVRITI